MYFTVLPTEIDVPRTMCRYSCIKADLFREQDYTQSHMHINSFVVSTTNACIALETGIKKRRLPVSWWYFKNGLLSGQPAKADKSGLEEQPLGIHLVLLIYSPSQAFWGTILIVIIHTQRTEKAGFNYLFKLQRASDTIRIAIQAARFALCCTLRFSWGTTWGTSLPVILGVSTCLTNFIRPRRKISTDFSTQLALW